MQARATSLPEYPQLEVDVRFWERVFSDVSTTACVFHDRDNLAMVYGVAEVGVKGSKTAQLREKRYMATINNAIERLATNAAPRTKLERIIASKALGSVSSLANLRGNVRCQRGVDFRPSYERSKQHLPVITRLLVKHKLPLDLAYLPHLS